MQKNWLIQFPNWNIHFFNQDITQKKFLLISSKGSNFVQHNLFSIFNQLKFSKKINLEDLKNYNLFELIQLVDKENINKKNILDIDFLKSTYVGYMYGDHLLDDENINKLVNAIYDVIS